MLLSSQTKLPCQESLLRTPSCLACTHTDMTTYLFYLVLHLSAQDWLCESTLTSDILTWPGHHTPTCMRCMPSRWCALSGIISSKTLREHLDQFDYHLLRIHALVEAWKCASLEHSTCWKMSGWQGRQEKACTISCLGTVFTCPQNLPTPEVVKMSLLSIRLIFESFQDRERDFTFVRTIRLYLQMIQC